MSDEDDPTAEPESLLPEGHSATESPVERRRRETRRAREDREREEFWKDVFRSAVGRREIWRMLFTGDGTHPFETRFPAGPVGFPDPNAAWYSRGEQDFGLRLYHSLLQIDRAGVLRMQDEHDPRFTKPKRPKGE